MKTLFLYFIVGLLFIACEDKQAEVKSNCTEIESFSFKEIDLELEFDEDYEAQAVLPDDTDLGSLTAIFKVCEGAKVFVGNKLQTSGYTKNDFSSPVVYTVVAEDGTTAEYTVSLYKEIGIYSFDIEELKNIDIEISSEGNVISATVPYGTNLKDLTATFDISVNASLFVDGVEQISGETKNDFDQPLTYTLKGPGVEDINYQVEINVAENEAPLADAGDDQLILIPQDESNAMVWLDATESSDPEGEMSAFEWKVGDEVISISEKEQVKFGIGVHNIQLMVEDAGGLTATDEVVVEIRYQGEYIPVDPDATQETKNLLTNLATIGNSEEFIFGQEFPLSFKLDGIRWDMSTSDCKDVTGDHPGVFGIDPHYMLYKSTDERELHIEEARYAYENGGIVTFDFHQQSRYDHKIYIADISDDRDKRLMYDIVNEQDGARQWFYDELDIIIDMINNDLGFPIVFRLYHEMNGDWFWWGTSATNHSKQLYIDFFRLTVDYIRERSKLVLFSWSPNHTFDTSYYPGNNYVDVVGVDVYEPGVSHLTSVLTELSEFGINNAKVSAFTETGQRNNYINDDPDFWTGSILTAIKNGGTDIKISWVLAWFNAPWHPASAQDELFIPNSESPQDAKDDFIDFYNDEVTLFLQDIKEKNIYE